MLAFNGRWCFSLVIVCFSLLVFHPPGQNICGFCDDWERGRKEDLVEVRRGARLMEGGEKMADE